MRVINETEWRSDHLRAIIARSVRAETDPESRRRIKVTVAYGRRPSWVAPDGHTYSTGNAYIGSPQYPGSIRVFVPREQIDHIDFAYVVAHEVAHATGLRHKDMRGTTRYDRVPGHRERYAWAEAMPIEKVAPKAKARPGVEERLALALRREKEWVTRQRRAETALKKYRRRIKDLRRQAASSSAATAASTNELVITGPGYLRTDAKDTPLAASDAPIRASISAAS